VKKREKEKVKMTICFTHAENHIFLERENSRKVGERKK